MSLCSGGGGGVETRAGQGAHLVGVEDVVEDGVDVGHVQRRHGLDVPRGVLEGHQTHIEVDLVQVAAVKRIQLHRRETVMDGYYLVSKNISIYI